MDNNYSNDGGERPVGPIIGLVLVVLIIVVGAIYFAIDRSRNSGIPTTNVPGSQTVTPPGSNNLEDLSLIESDLNSISTTDMDADIGNIQ